MSQATREQPVPRNEDAASQTLERCRGWLINRFDEALAVLLERVDHTLFALTEEGDSDPLRGIYFEVMRDIRKRRKAMHGATEAELSARLGAALRGERLTAPSSSAHAGIEAGCVLALDAMANRVRLACKENSLRPRRAFMALLRQHDHAVGARPDERGADALDATLFCAAIQHAALALEVEPRTRLVFLKLFERHLAPELIKLYNELDTFFVEAGVDALDTLGVQLDDASAQSPMAEVKLTLQRLLRDIPSRSDQGAASAQTGAYATEEQRATIYRELRQTLAQPLESPSEVAASLAQLVEASANPSAGRHEIFHLLLELATAQLPTDLRALATVATLPLVDLQRRSPAWHTRPRHPARLWLQALAALPPPTVPHPGDASVSATQNALQRALVRVIQMDPDWLNSADILRSAALGRPSVGTAEAYVDGDMANLLGAARAVDPRIRRFANDYWKGVMVMRYLRDGGAGSTYQQAAERLTTLAWCLEPDPEADVRRRQTEALPDLMHAIEAGLKELGLSAAEGCQVAAALLAAPADSNEQTHPHPVSKPFTALHDAQLDELLKDAMERANLHVFKTARSKAGCKGMAASAAAVLISGSRAALAHVGDARIYLLRDAKLEALGSDHSLANQLAPAGPVAAPHQSAAERVLTRALGERDTVTIDLAAINLAAHDRLLICTDGLTDSLPGPTIAAALASEREPSAAATTLANAVAGRNADNATLCVIGCEADDGTDVTIAMGEATVGGTTRHANQDAVHCDAGLGLAVVCDGSGSRGAGAVAAGMVVYTVAEQVEKGLRRLRQTTGPAPAPTPVTETLHAEDDDDAPAPWDESPSDTDFDSCAHALPAGSPADQVIARLGRAEAARGADGESPPRQSAA